ncbi:MotA/TolQ/ExbB proton channel family protein [Flavobacterium salilacus subsp. salilacus]|uniref:MotA/TolQ/ExbB proton channel family protein n=1 Tax=Flavobacterium TaxID=237 RepID=UPI0010754D60|nr:MULTISPECIES: MotA/TolQ/ExbB proton channel family protein [Flavobacterium]KAF2514145.1 MotA/TolQ/ExbB proton channel family protein [Flavobacterium salilacus subsp. salilacus]MBE1615196.1 MotA/TolQ/ExbB proton channel family protein [Flavobacterium sp. SaA2.13]NDI99399.1 MotA/TolQ/ExbB proton channel family protein [Flavobacterium salilacus subsp. altitudinum]
MANASIQKVEKKGESKGSNVFAGLAIILCLIVAALVWAFIMGHPSNFQDGDPEGHPLPGNYLAMVYKGGYVVPVLMGLFLMSVVFSIERLFVINKAAGKGNVETFVRKVQNQIAAGNINEAMAECDKQQGTVANVVKAGLLKYEEVKREGFDSERAEAAIQQEIEEATSLEMPMLEKNLVVISTLVSIGTLCGLLGTVTGMIKAFSALGAGSTPDSAALANGISEALINTATGIATSTLAVIAYNAFTSKIDKLTYSIDEAGFTIAQTYRRFRARANNA